MKGKVLFLVLVVAMFAFAVWGMFPQSALATCGAGGPCPTWTPTATATLTPTVTVEPTATAIPTEIPIATEIPVITEVPDIEWYEVFLPFIRADCVGFPLGVCVNGPLVIEP